MTQELDVEGWFWLEGTEHKVAGRLTYNMHSGPELHLIGSFHPDNPFPDRDIQAYVHGIANGKQYTLLNCYRTASSFGMPGALSETYSPESVLQGAHLDNSHPLEFDSVTFEISHLHSWIGKKLTNRALQQDGELRFVVSPPHKESIEVNIGELQLTVDAAHSWRTDSDEPLSLKEHAIIGVNLSKSKKLDDIRLISSTIKDLVTIGADAPSSITKITVHKQNSGEQTTDLNLYEDTPLDFDQEDGYRSRLRMMFTFDDIGGIEGIAKWLDHSSDVRPVLGFLLSHWYLPKLYLENQFLNVVIALEALGNIRSCGKNSLRQTLKCHYDSAGHAFQSSVPDRNTWVELTAKLRGKIAHGTPLRDTEYDRLIPLTDSIYLLTVISLLKECGIKVTYNSIAAERRLRTIKGELSQL